MAEVGQMLAVERIVDLCAVTKPEALRELAELLRGCPQVSDTAAFLKAILDREKIISNGIGLGIAVPHAKAPCVKGFVMCLGRSVRGLPFDALDDQPVNLVVMIGAPEAEKEQYLKVMSRIVLFLKKKENREQVLRASGPAAIYELFKGL